MTSDQKKSIDELLSDGVLTPPDDFAEVVINRIAQSSMPDSSQLTAHHRPSQNVWPSIAVAASALLGMFQVIGFIVGIWIPVTAG